MFLFIKIICFSTLFLGIFFNSIFVIFFETSFIFSASIHFACITTASSISLPGPETKTQLFIKAVEAQASKFSAL